MKKILQYFKEYKFIACLAPTFKLLEALLELLIPLFVARIVNDGIDKGNAIVVIRCVLYMILCGSIGLVLSITGQYFAAKTAVYVSKSVRLDLFKKITSFSYTNIDEMGTSSLITRMTSDVNQLQTGINLTLRLFLRSPFVVFGAAIMATVLSPKVSIIFWILIPVLSIIVFGIILITMPRHKAVQENLDTVLNQTRENLTGNRVIRAFSIEDYVNNEFESSLKQLEKSQNKAQNLSNLMNPLTYVLINIAIVILIYVGALEVSSKLMLQGTVIALYNYISQILVELIKLANLIVTMTKSVTCGKRIEKILSMDTTSSTLVDPTCYPNYIAVQDVSFTYPGAGAPTLKHLSFTVNKGETIGIIGGTGSGKTTLVELLSKNYPVTEGKIIIDYNNINNFTKEDIKELVSPVLQKAVLFKGSIKENILVGKKDATDEEIYEALRIAQGIEIVEKKAEGLDAFVEQGGKNFSGGQRQRLAIARTIVKKPEILILDDSSSALDYATDAALRKAIKSLSYKPTTFIISQRTSAIQNADKIIVLDDGCMVGFDTHENLMKNCLIYQEIYHSQFKESGGKNE